jgi:hypothetical protein
MIVRVLVSLACVLGLLSVADAQGIFCPPRQPVFGQPGFGQPGRVPPGRTRGPQQPNVPMDKFEADGTVQGVAPGRIFMQTLTNQKWVVHLSPNAEILVKGKAESDFLQAGMYVKFNTDIDKRGKGVGKLTQMSITTPTVADPLGYWAEGAVGAPGAPAAGGANPNAAAAAPAPPLAAEPGARQPPPPSQRYTVHGRISKLDKGQMTVVAPGAKVEVEVDEKCAIDVAFADYTVARSGDKISVVRGQMPAGLVNVPAGMVAYAQAQEVEIELVNPLTGFRKQPKVVRKPGEGEKPGEGAEKPAEGAGKPAEGAQKPAEGAAAPEGGAAAKPKAGDAPPQEGGGFGDEAPAKPGKRGRVIERPKIGRAHV